MRYKLFKDSSYSWKARTGVKYTSQIYHVLFKKGLRNSSDQGVSHVKLLDFVPVFKSGWLTSAMLSRVA